MVLLLVFLVVFIFKLEKRTGGLLEEEKYFVDYKSGEQKPFPLYYQGNDIDLSVVVPAYNEEKRISPMLDDALEYLHQKTKKDPSFKYEIIVVSDGSKDKTEDVVSQYVIKETSERMRFLKLRKNRGKGGATKRGVIVSRGKYVLMVDADGATKFSDLEKLLNEIETARKGDHAVVVGSRHHLEQEAIAQRTFFRNLLMWVFHFMVLFLCNIRVKDTQCGFKLFTRASAQLLFTNMHIERWAFDVELLYIAQARKIPVKEVAVTWHEIDGSTLNPVLAGIQMARDILKVRIAYLLGLWRIETLEKLKYH